MLPALLALQGATEVFGIRLVGVSAATGKKLLLTAALVLLVVVVSKGVRWLLGPALRGEEHERARFWMRQAVHLVAAAIFAFGLVSIWFEDPARLAGAAGIITAGVAIALQRVITSFAAYLIVLRGRVYTVGDRITMGGVRGDVIALGFMQTTVMEMGEPPSVQSADPPVWVAARQYTGRIVRITNDKIFDSPVYNYTRQFPYLWEEIRLPVKYDADRRRAEAILLDAATRHTAPIVARAEPAYAELRKHYFLPEDAELRPRVYWRLTDNWLELAVRFLTEERGVRGLKDAMSRDIVLALQEAKIEIASGTYEIVGMPTLRVQLSER